MSESAPLNSPDNDFTTVRGIFHSWLEHPRLAPPVFRAWRGSPLPRSRHIARAGCGSRRPRLLSPNPGSTEFSLLMTAYCSSVRGTALLHVYMERYVVFRVCLRISKGEHDGTEEFSCMLVLLLQGTSGSLQQPLYDEGAQATGRSMAACSPLNHKASSHGHGSQEAKRNTRVRWLTS